MERANTSFTGGNMKSYWKHILWIATGIGGLFVFLIYYPLLFPSIPMLKTIGKEEAEKITTTYLKRYVDYSKYTWSAILNTDTREEIFLHLTHKIILDKTIPSRLERICDSSFWEIKGLNPSNKKEYIVFVGAYSGRVKGFSFPKERRGKIVSWKEAENITSNFLTKEIKDFTNYSLISYSSNKEMDGKYIFTWQNEKFMFDGIRLRAEVEINGDEVVRFNQYLKVPEESIEKLEKEMEKGVIFGGIYGMGALFLCGVCLFVILNNRINILQYLKILFPIASSIFILTFFSSIIDQTFLENDFDVITLITDILSGIFLFFLMGIGGGIISERFAPNPPSLLQIFSLSWICSSKGFLSIYKGYILGFLWAGYFVIFYVISKKYLGAWIPLNPQADPSSLVSISFPIGILESSVGASFIEEFTFRLVAILFLMKYLRIKFLAVLIPAMVWSFGHSEAPILPIYLRGIELGIIGIMLGYSFLKYGIITPIIAHYVINTLMNAYPLISGDSKIIVGITLLLLLLLPYIIIILGLRSILRLK